jgi:transposase
MDKFVGVDVCKAKLDTFSGDRGWAVVQNEGKAIKCFLKTVPKGSIIALESTGGYGKLLADLAVKAGFTVYLVQPAKVKKFRASSPVRGKTDKIDAEAVHDYLEVHQTKLHPYQQLPALEARLQKLARTRSAIVKKAASLRMQLASLGDNPQSIKNTLAALTKRIDGLNEEIAQILESTEDAKVLLTIPAVKAGFISSLLPALRTIEFESKYSLDSYVGIDLLPDESGKTVRKRRMSKQGDKYARHAVFMAGLSGTTCKVWRPYYESLLNDKKLKKIEAVNVLGRKILHTAYGVYKTQTVFKDPWAPKEQPTAAAPTTAI